MSCRAVLQAPAWQPPLPQEAPKAPEVKAEPQQQVMSEYERFMAEVRWAPLQRSFGVSATPHLRFR